MAQHAWNGEHNWVVCEPITQEKMNSLEGGVATALEQQSEITSLDSRLDKIDGGNAFSDAIYNTLAEKVEAVKGRADRALSDASDAMQATTDGAKAWTEVSAIVTINQAGEVTKHLAECLQEIDNKAIGAAREATTAQTWINDAKVIGTVLKDGVQVVAGSLAEKIADIDRKISNVESTANGVSTTINPQNGNLSFGERLTNLDANTIPSMNVPQIITEISNARGQNAQGGNNTTLSQRFAQDETRIGANETAIGNLQTDKVNVSDIVDNLNQTDTNKPLSAKQGNVIKQMFGTGVGTTAGTTVVELISTAQTNATNNANTHTDGLLGNGFTTTNTVAARIDAIDNASTGSIAGLDARLDAIDGGTALTGNTLASRVNALETEVDTANGSSTLNARFGAIEDRLDAIDDGSNTTIADLDGRLDDAEDAIDDLEDIINHETTGLAATKAIADAAKAKADTALQPADISQLNTDVNNLKDKQTSYTEVIHNVNYDANGKPQISNPSEDVDYLIKGTNPDTKYYYWKYIKTSTNPDVFSWELISGAGGSGGNNSGYDYATNDAYLSATKAENTDYYVTKADGVHHYRWVMVDDVLTEIEISNFIDKDNIKRYNITKSTGDNDTNYLDLYEFAYGEDSTIYSDALPPVSQRVAHILLPQGGGGSAVTSTTRLVRIPPTSITTIVGNESVYLRFFYSCVDATQEAHEATYVLKDKNGMTVASGDINSGAADETVSAWPTGKADGTVYNDGYASINVANYCTLGNNEFNLTVTTNNGETLYRKWTVTMLELRIESTAPETALIPVGEDYSISYTPYGAMDKTLYVKFDNNDATIQTVPLGQAVTGVTQEYVIPASSLTHGAHTVDMYLKASINGVEETTAEHVVRDYIWYDSANETTPIIIASPMRLTGVTAQQYSTVEIPYTIYNGTSNSYDVSYYYNYNPSGTNTAFDTITLTNTNTGTLRYVANTSGNHNLAIKVGETYITIPLVVTPLNIDIAPVAGELIDFDPSVLTNNSQNRLPTWTKNGTTYSLSVSENFNWSNDISGGGYKEDEDGKCFVIKAGSYAYLDYKMFKQHNVSTSDGTVTTNAVFDDGAEMKLIFKVTAVRDAGATWFTNMGKYAQNDNKQVGIQLRAHEGWLKTSKATDEDTAQYDTWTANTTYAVGDLVIYDDAVYRCKTANNDAEWTSGNWETQGSQEASVVSTNSYLYFPYSEDDKIELDININRSGNNEDFIMSYEDGVPSKAYPYSAAADGDILYQIPGSESIIQIGSPDCDVHIYRLRIYNKGLETNKILKNFIADGATVNERIDRYNRNSIYYDSTLNNNQGGFTPYAGGNAVLDPIKLSERVPDVKILMLDTPVFTTSKNDYVKNSTLRCLQAIGGKVYPANLDADNWFFGNGYHAGQGTTSDNYGQAGRNVDFLFECDGVNAPAKKKNVSGYEDYQSYVVRGANASIWNSQTQTWQVADGQTREVCQNWKGDQCKVSLTHNKDTGANTSVPNNYFNLKVNIASSENVNNALFQKRYNDFLPYNSPAKQRDSRIKNDMEFVPAILFIRENAHDEQGNPVGHTEFNDCNWHFYALGNIGDSKKTDYTRAYDPTDMNEFTIEISDNNTNNSQFQSGVFMDGNTRTVETSAIAESTTINSMEYIFPITPEEWNAKDGNNQYINYRHKMLSSEAFDGKHSFEFRYACRGDYRDGDLINQTAGQDDDAQFNINRAVWEAFYEWVITSTQAQYENEIALWVVPSAVEFFYAFTHYYTMMDNRAKNTFWHFAKTGVHRAVPIGRAVPALFHIYEVSDGNGGYEPATGTFDNTEQYYTQYAFDLWTYDTDTAAGIDNNGALIFPYGKEDRDYRVTGDIDSGYAFNGAGSIFWRRLSDTFPDEIATIMTQVDGKCFSDAEDLINEFDKFQACYPEEIWRLDIQRKYIRTFTGLSYDNSLTAGKRNIRFLRSMMQGRKKYQRRQWIRNQAIYFGSKYRLNNVITDAHSIEIVCTTPGDTSNLAVPLDYTLKITPYQDMYINVEVGNGNVRGPVGGGDGPIRAIAGQEVSVDCSGEKHETRIYIRGAEHIQGLGNLAAMYFYDNEFGRAKRLKVLNIGTDNPNYNNPSFTTLNIDKDMPILETLNVKNCNNLTGSIDLSQSYNLRVVEAEGTKITGVSLPDYSSIRTLHLPSTVTSVALKSARLLTDFYIKNKATGEIDYTHLINLNINDSDYSSNINWLTIATEALNNVDSLYLQNLSTSSIINISELEPFLQRKNELETQYDDDGNLIKRVVLSGNLTVSGEWSTIEKTLYESTWSQPQLNLVTNPANQQTKHKVMYKLDANDSDDDALYTMYVSDGSTIVDILYNHLVTEEDVAKAPTAQYEYTFGSRNQTLQYIRWSGWRRSNKSISVQQEYQNGIAATVTGNLTLVAVYTSTDRVYPVKWWMNRGDTTPVRTSETVPYGGGYNLEAPTVKDIQDAGFVTSTITPHNTSPKTVSYKIFTGWDKLPINIAPLATDTAYNIYATYSEGDNIPVTTLLNNLDNPTPEQLAVLAALDDEDRVAWDLAVNDRMSVTMGYDSQETGRLLIGDGATETMTSELNETGNYYIARFDDATQTVPFEANIAPLAAGNDAFTLAIDYTFADNVTYGASVKEAVLVSCYSNSGGSVAGFKLFYNLDYSSQNGNVPIGPRVGFGDTRTIGNLVSYSRPVGPCGTPTAPPPSYRNMIVLRHPKNSPKLYIYSGAYSDNGILTSTDDEHFVQEIEWSNINTNAKLTFGNLFLNSTSTEMVGAQGTIYWAKYWDKDLGAGECKQLASWCHEPMTFALEEFSGMQESRFVFPQLTNRPNLVFTSMNASQYGHVAMKGNRTLGETIGWSTSKMRDVANNRIMLGLPTKLQAVIRKSPVQSKNATYVKIDYTDSYIVSGDAVTTNDYIFVPSAVELSSNVSSATYGAEALGMMKWINPAQLIVRQYSTGSVTWPEVSNADNINYMNLRFPIYPLKVGTRSNHVYIGYTPSTSIYTSINSSVSGGVQRGDIFIDQTDTAYIYVTADDVINGAPIVIDNTGLYSCPGGGWVKAEPWWTRTVYDSNNFTVTFMYVNEAGTLINTATNSYTDKGYGFNYSFSI